MFFFLFSRFLFNPKLMLTDLRSEYGEYLALIAAFIAVATFHLSNALVFHYRITVTEWFLGSLLNLAGLLLFALLYLPSIHLFAEKNLPGSRISDLFAYSGFIMAPLLLSLPLALISMAVRSTGLYVAALVVIIVDILVNLIKGVKDNYQLSAGYAVYIFFAPLLFVVLFLFIIGLLTAILYV